ncbi:MAG: hypothetical protein RL748_4458 [Pseudomonadota bacterium]|jgi:hypothetical protein
MASLLSGFVAHRAKCLIIVILLLPALGALLAGKGASQENRNLAKWPEQPRTWPQMQQYPGKIERWFNDHLGLREELIALNNRLRYRLFHQFPTPQVLQGKNGRIFLASHTRDQADYLAVQNVCGYQYHDLPQLVEQFNDFGRTMQKQRLDAYLLLIPSAPVLYPEELPDWLAARCNAQLPPIQLALQDPQVQFKSRLLYPRQALLQAKASQSVFAKTFFHWSNAGPRIASELSMQQFWHTNPAQAPALQTQTLQQPSDIANLFPGVRLNSEVEVINFVASGIKQCHGPACYPELGPIAARLWGVNRFHNPAAPRQRLVLISDSFGLNLGPWYARYYQDVVQISSNDFGLLSAPELAQLKAFVFQHASSQDLLFAYHDGTIQGGKRISSDLNIIFGAQR